MLARDAGRSSASTRLRLGIPGARVLPGRTAYALPVVSDTTRMSRSVPDVATRHLGKPPSYEFAGFVAIRNENPVLDEEERFAERNLVRTHPQWDGNVVARWTIGTGWALRLCQNEEVRWLNEGKAAVSPRA